MAVPPQRSEDQHGKERRRRRARSRPGRPRQTQAFRPSGFNLPSLPAPVSSFPFLPGATTAKTPASFPPSAQETGAYHAQSQRSAVASALYATPNYQQNVSPEQAPYTYIVIFDIFPPPGAANRSNGQEMETMKR
jgi:hypothetical protein